MGNILSLFVIAAKTAVATVTGSFLGGTLSLIPAILCIPFAYGFGPGFGDFLLTVAYYLPSVSAIIGGVGLGSAVLMESLK